MSRGSTTPGPRLGPSPLQLAKAAMDIPALARACGWDWRPGRSCKIPWREDRSPSGSVIAEGRLLHDFTTGENHDAPAVLAEMTGLSLPDACREFIRIAGVKPGDAASAPLPVRKAPRVEPPPRKPSLPRLDVPTRGEFRALAKARGLPVGALVEASRRGLLWAGRWKEARCWLLTDSTGWVAQARRFDGVPFSRGIEGGGTFKAYTLPGSRAGWPVGLPDAIRRRRIALVEGGPDLLAALALAAASGCLDDLGVVAVLGAGCRLVEDALPHFRGCRVRLFPHADPPRPDGTAPGLEGAARWQDQLDAAGATVDAFDLGGLTAADGRHVKDLNDAARDWAQLTAADPELAAAFDF